MEATNISLVFIFLLLLFSEQMLFQLSFQHFVSEDNLFHPFYITLCLRIRACTCVCVCLIGVHVSSDIVPIHL